MILVHILESTKCYKCLDLYWKPRLNQWMPLCPGLDEHGQSGDYSFANLGGMKASGTLERQADPAATTAFEASHLST